MENVLLALRSAQVRTADSACAGSARRAQTQWFPASSDLALPPPPLAPCTAGDNIPPPAHTTPVSPTVPATVAARPRWSHAEASTPAGSATPAPLRLLPAPDSAGRAPAHSPTTAPRLLAAARWPNRCRLPGAENFPVSPAHGQLATRKGHPHQIALSAALA